MEEQQQQEVKERPVRKSRKWARIVRRIVLALIGFILLVLLVFQIPAVQTWAARQAIHYLSQKLNTEVSIDRISLLFLNRFDLQHFYLEDYAGDTLLYSRSLKVNLTINPFTLGSDGLRISSVELEKTKFYWVRREGQVESDFERILATLFPKKEKKSEPIKLQLRRLNLQDVDFVKSDEVQGSYLHAYLRNGQILMDTFDLSRKLITATAIHLENPLVEIENRKGVPLPDSLQMLVDERKAGPIRDTVPFSASIDRLTLAGGTFRLDNYRKDSVEVLPDSVLDYQHMLVRDIQIGIDEFQYSDFRFRGSVDVISGKEKSGFILDRLSSSDVIVSPEEVTLRDLLIETPQSRITRFFQMRYSSFLDFRDFVDRVRMRGDLTGATVSISDILTFAPGLRRNRFFRDNRDQVVRINGQVRGSVNRLRIRDLDAQLANGTLIQGRFSSNDITDKDNARLNIRLDKLQTKAVTLSQLFPWMQFPTHFSKLGKLSFQGSYDGFFEDFVANGILVSEIGTARMDMRMNLLPGKERAEYSGALALENFDLGRWTGNPDLGQITVSSEVLNGVGLTAKTAYAELIARVASLSYKGYQYENAVMEGALNENRFDGEFNITDDNIDFFFQGKVDFSQGAPDFDFQAEIRRMALKELNITEEDFLLSGGIELDIVDTDPADMTGRIGLRDFRVRLPDEEELEIDSLFLRAAISPDSVKTYQLEGNLLQGKIEGRFNLMETPAIFTQVLDRNFPEFARRLGIKKDTLSRAPQAFIYELSIPESGGFEKLVNDRLGPMDGTRVNGYLDSEKDSLLVDLLIPTLRYDSIVAHRNVVILDLFGKKGGLDMTLDSVYLNRNLQLGQTVLLSLIDQGSLLFGFNTEQPISNQAKSQGALVDNVNINGSFLLKDSTGFRVEFDDSDIFLFQERWKIDPDNYLEFSSEAFETRHFYMTNGTQLVEIKNMGRRGLDMRLFDLDFSYLNTILDYEPLDFDGNYEVVLQVQDAYKLEELSLEVNSSHFILNEEDRGALSLTASTPDPSGILDADFRLEKGNQSLQVNGFMNLADQAEGEQIPPEKKGGYFDFHAAMDQFPAKVGGYFIDAVLEDMTGDIKSQARVYGLPERPNIQGEVRLQDVAFTVSYLQTRYRVEEGATFAINNQAFDGTGTRIFDIYGHEAILSGGIRHDNLGNFRLGAELEVDQLQVMDTDQEDNEQFYGHALGTGSIRFSGPFKQPNVYINATVGERSRLTIPVSSAGEESQLNFVEFVDQAKVKAQQNGKVRQTVELKGLEIEMDLSVEEEAVVEIVFDEQSGDVLRGQGRGNLQINVTRDGQFQIFGNYRITQGSYLFTMYNVVNKQFSIKEGGMIQFTGDPLRAQLNIKAEYTALSTSVANFIQEYLQAASATLKNDASKSTRVILEMSLSGPLEKPVIGFDIFFPDLTGELLNLCESKMRILRRDQNELNRQVFGLIVAGQFLPSDSNLQGSSIFYNTVSEFLSNQLSMLLTGLFSEIISDGAVLSGIDIDVAYSNYQAADLGEGQDYTSGSEFQVRLRQDFFNDRLTVIVGGNIDVGGNITAPDAANGTFIGNDLVIEYTLNKDRTLKLRVYQKLQPDLGGGSRLQVGTGLSFRKEYDEFSEFLKSIGNKLGGKKKKRTEDKPENKVEKKEPEEELLGSN